MDSITAHGTFLMQQAFVATHELQATMLDGNKARSCLRFESKEHNSIALSAAASGPVECGSFLPVG